MKQSLLYVSLVLFSMSCASSNSYDVKKYGSQEKSENGYNETFDRDKTGSSQKTEAERTIIPLDQHLSKLSGVIVNGSGPRAQVSIRGFSSFSSQTNEPLFVVDNISMNSYTDVYNYINPADIASVTVLKDGGEGGIYGVRGANGVIIIKTKKQKIKQ
jgi:TonB-dependent SusC/RagA subfamily outer membrane receptor